MENNDKNTQQMPEELIQLTNAVEKQQFETVRTTAHSLKSTVGYVGLADDLNPYLTRMEQDAAAFRTNDMKLDLDYVKSKCEAALSEVEIVLQNGSL